MKTILDSLPMLLRGAGVSLALVACAVTTGLVLGVPIGIGVVYGPRTLRAALWIFDRIFRGFPAIVLLFIAFFGLGSLPGVSLSPFAAVVLALGLRSAAYQGQIFRGALGMIDRGQGEAARALGMTFGSTLLSILLPQAARFSLPSLSNEYAIVLKDTALAFTVGVVELMSRGKFAAMRTRETFAVYLAVAGIYLVLTYGGIAAFRLVELRTRLPGFGTARRRTGRR